MESNPYANRRVSVALNSNIMKTVELKDEDMFEEVDYESPTSEAPSSNTRRAPLVQMPCWKDDTKNDGVELVERVGDKIEDVVAADVTAAEVKNTNVELEAEVAAATDDTENSSHGMSNLFIT